MTEPNISFDRAAGFYDQTRTLSEPMATIGVQTILDLAGPHGSILEVGIGTGRLGVPLLQRGANLIGCDLSIKMMNKLRA
jgi:16S rRNA A1518/A1519 N6-dimethyltransferase RsmA/KsgA/DIM1 with predicted DNA glycosylase/AP lyase activity